MIPKIIHYCWFGGNPKPDDVKKYIASWHIYCPDYEIKEWNESNFDLNENAYCREAYEAKKWAFVTDYVRLKVLYEYGGIYMDTDVEVVKNFDNLLLYSGFMCFENDKSISIGTLGIVKNSTLVMKFLKAYANRHFRRKDGTLDLKTNLLIITPILVNDYGVHLNGKKQLLKDNILILPMEAFIAKSYVTGCIMKNEDTYAIHHYMGSWLAEETKQMSIYSQKYYQQYKKYPLPHSITLQAAKIKAAYELGGITKIASKTFGMIQRHLNLK